MPWKFFGQSPDMVIPEKIFPSSLIAVQNLVDFCRVWTYVDPLESGCSNPYTHTIPHVSPFWIWLL